MQELVRQTCTFTWRQNSNSAKPRETFKAQQGVSLSDFYIPKTVTSDRCKCFEEIKTKECFDGKSVNPGGGRLRWLIYGECLFLVILQKCVTFA
jgi:hypothetical protein